MYLLHLRKDIDIRDNDTKSESVLALRIRNVALHNNCVPFVSSHYSFKLVLT